MTILDRLRSADIGSRELDAEIMFDLFAKPVGERKDGGPVGYLWPEDNPSWNFGLRFPDSTKEQILTNRKHVDGETLIIERDGANVLMNSIRIPLATTSIDAALALVDKMLPDALWTIGHRGDETPNLFMCVIMPSSGAPFHETHQTPALAILTALFTALEAKG